jgi:hypothetical protein
MGALYPIVSEGKRKRHTSALTLALYPMYRFCLFTILNASRERRGWTWDPGPAPSSSSPIMSKEPGSCIDIPASGSAAVSLQYLPDDITLLIATEFVDDNNAFRDLCILTSICSHLRTLFLNTPGLWTAIDFEAQPTPWIDLCIYCARDTPISLELYINGDFHHEIELGRRCLSKASRLSVYLIRHSKAALSAFWRAFDSSIDASRLEMLDITGSPFVEVLLDLNRPCLLKASKLCRMKLVNATVQELPQLPALVNLEIQRAYISPGCLHSLFVSAPGLSKICLSDTKLTAQHVAGAMDQIYLPRLQTLQILHSSLEAVAAILHMISNPHCSLIIRVGNAEWNAPDNTYRGPATAGSRPLSGHPVIPRHL